MTSATPSAPSSSSAKPSPEEGEGAPFADALAKLPDGIAVFLYARVFAALLQVGALAVLANVLEKAELAYVSFVLVVVATASALGSLGLGDAVFYLVGRDEHGGPKVVRQATFLLSLAALPVLVIVGLVLFLGHPAVDLRGEFFPSLVIVIALELSTQPAVNLLVSVGEPKRASAVYSAFSAMSLAAVVVPAVLGLPIETTVHALAGISLLKGLLYVWVVRHHFPSTGPWLHKAELRAIASYSIPIGLSNLAGTLNKQLDKIVVGLVLTDAVFAEFAVGAFELPLLTLIPYAIATLQQPLYVRMIQRGAYDSLRAMWYRGIEKTALVMLPSAAVLIAFAEDIIVLVFSEKYRPAALPFQLFTGVLFLRVAAYGPLIRAGGDARPLLRFSLLLIVVNVTLSVPLTLLVGAPGAAVATLSANWIVFLATLPLVAKSLHTNVAGSMPWRRLGEILAVALGAALASWLVAGLPSGLSHAAHLALGLGVFTALYLAAARALGLMAAGDLRYLVDFVTLAPLRRRRPRA